MNEFWSYMAPFLIAAVLPPATIVLNLWLIPSDEWAERVIRDWADSEGLRVATIDESPDGSDRGRLPRPSGWTRRGASESARPWSDAPTYHEHRDHLDQGSMNIAGSLTRHLRLSRSASGPTLRLPIAVQRWPTRDKPVSYV